MPSFDFKRSGRKCSISGREFQVGEEYISALLENDGAMTRNDVAADQWEGPPNNCIGWWKSRVPDLAKGRVYWAPRDVLLAFFQHLVEHGEPDQIYVMAILLIQKKQFKLLDTMESEQGQIMELIDPSSRERYEVSVVEIAESRVNQIQQEFAEKLFTDIAPTQE